MTAVLPSPLRIPVELYKGIKVLYAEKDLYPAQRTKWPSEDYFQNLSQQCIATAFRTTLAASAALLTLATGCSLYAAAALGSLLSLPAACIAGGTWLLYHGVAASIPALATGAFQTLGIAIAGLVSGYCLLEFNAKFNRIGIIDYGIIDPWSKDYRMKFLEYLTGEKT